MAKKTVILSEARLESQLRAKSNALRDTDKKYRAIQDDLEKTREALGNALQ